MTDLTSLSCTAAGFAGLSAEILGRGKTLRFTAQGASMHPLVRNGDILSVQPVQPGQIRVGDVVLYCTTSGRIVVHRVIRRLPGLNGFHFLVQGDQMNQPDGIIPQEQIYGRLTVIERDGSYLDMSLPSPRMLGWFAALRSRWSFLRGKIFRWIGQPVKRMRFFYRYLV